MRWIPTTRSTEPASLNPDLDELLATCSHLAALADRIRDFARLLTERRGQDLDAWLATVDADSAPPGIGVKTKPATRVDLRSSL